MKVAKNKDKMQLLFKTIRHYQGAKLKEIVGGVYNPNVPTNRTFLGFYQQCNVDGHY